MDNDSRLLTLSFVGLAVGLAIIVVGVFMGMNLVVLVAGGVVALASLTGFLRPALELEAEGGSSHAAESSATNHH